MRFPQGLDGYYDDNGVWQRTKFCFVYCGDDRCTCLPPEMRSLRDHKVTSGAPTNDQTLGISPVIKK